MLKIINLCLFFSFLGYANQEGHRIRVVMNYPSSNDTKLLVRLKCLLNPPLHRCTHKQFEQRGKDECSKQEMKFSSAKYVACIRHPQGIEEEVCTYADINCVK